MSRHDRMRVELHVPPMACVVASDVFDAWAWCESDVVTWRRAKPETRLNRPIDGNNPPGLVFVVHDRTRASFRPRELARLHTHGHGFEEEEALAPWAIDDATDLLYEHRVRPRDALYIAADSLEALTWGLHDWVHFHNHGPFDDPPSTELQCDLVALAWLRLNRSHIGCTEEELSAVARDLAALSRRRFAEAGRTRELENLAPELDALFDGPYPHRLQ
jgi:hypothetical protein